MARPIRNHTFEDVYEPFCGSGTTIIACEHLKRTCYAMDIDPCYIAVTLERFLDATGIFPLLAT
jgi:DNA modification methylase